MKTHPANYSNQLIKKFGDAVKAFATLKELPNDKKKELIQAWQVVETAINSRSNDFEALAQYKSLVTYLKTSGVIDPNGREWNP
jgi:hypothetical protein